MSLVYILLAILLVVAALVLALAFWLSSLLLQSRRQPVTRTPASVGLAFEPVRITARDGVVLQGWWIPADSAASVECPRAVVLLHPMFGNRLGLLQEWLPWPHDDANDLELLPLAASWHQAGYAVLMFDFRNHGESGAGLSGGGLTEDQDVAAALDATFQRLEAGRLPAVTPQVGVVGFGLGAAAAIAAAGREKGGAETIKVFSGDSESASGFVEIPPPSAKRLAFLIAVQPASQQALLRSHLRPVAGPITPFLAALVDKFCQRRGGYPLGPAMLVKFAPEVHVPVLYVQSRADSVAACAEVQQFFDLAPARKELVWLEVPVSRSAGYVDVIEHPAPLLAFAQPQSML